MTIMLVKGSITLPLKSHQYSKYSNGDTEIGLGGYNQPHQQSQNIKSGAVASTLNLMLLINEAICLAQKAMSESNIGSSSSK